MSLKDILERVGHRPGPEYFSEKMAEMRPEDLKNEIFNWCGGEIDYPDVNGKTALMYAVKAGNIEVAKEALKLGANVNEASDGFYFRAKDDDTTRYGNRALDIAIALGNPEIRNEMVGLLVSHGADVNKGNPLGRALRLGYMDTAKKLYSAGADIRPALVETCKAAAIYEQDGSRAALDFEDKKLEFLRECGAGEIVSHSGGKIGSLNADEVQRVLANNLTRMDNKAKEVEKPNVPTQSTLNPASVKNHYSGRS